MKKEVNPWLVAVSVMLATFMVVLDSSVANVALPHIAGSLSASTDESTWVLTSYLVANAIILPATGWLAAMLGRKRLLMFSIMLFVGSSVVCGAAPNMTVLVLARILQGIGGGGMQPIAQAVLLETFPVEKRGAAMAVYGMGVVVAPIIGPTLGGWITDSYTWRWIFYINVPVGALALIMVNMFVSDPHYLKEGRTTRIDYPGFIAMAMWLGALQLALDKGQEADWFGTAWIGVAVAISAFSMLLFIWRELSVREPIVNLRVFKDRSFAVGTFITAAYGVILYGVTAMLPLFLQTLLGYPALQSGLAVSPRGIGSLVSMVVVGRLVDLVDNRILLAIGFVILALSSLYFGHINLGIAMGSITWPAIVNGFATGFIFVPLTTLSMAAIQKQEMGNATGIYNLMRNIGGSFGIATVTTLLARRAQTHQAILVGHLSQQNLTLQSDITRLSHSVTSGADPAGSVMRAYALIYQQVIRQATALAYVDIFHLMALLSLGCIPLILLFRKARRKRGTHTAAAE
jgi:MFS transporter, DHA2 family, multidrug resistance protein